MKSFDEVYSLVSRVPKGKVTTYGTVAKKLGISPRTVGYILHLNPDGKKTPCHRVVNFKGRIAPGFAFGGLGEHRKLLEKEGVIFRDAIHVDIKKHFFSFK